MQRHPEDEQQVRLDLPLAGGGNMAVEIGMVATVVDGRFAGAHGSVRDIRQRERLEQDLRRQAAALAANEERANLARELHDSVTQALFSMGLTARALELCSTATRPRHATSSTELTSCRRTRWPRCAR